MRLKVEMPLLLGIGLAGAVVATAMADSIPVLNGSFEDSTVGTVLAGLNQSGGTIPSSSSGPNSISGWNVVLNPITGGSYANGGWCSVAYTDYGFWNPNDLTGGAWWYGAPEDGKKFMLLTPGEPYAWGAVPNNAPIPGLSFALTSTGISSSAVAGTTYSAAAFAQNLNKGGWGTSDQYSSSNPFSPRGCDMTMNILANGVVVASQTVDAAAFTGNAATGTNWVPFTASWSAGTADAGKTIQIQMIASNFWDGQHGAGYQWTAAPMGVDNVTLSGMTTRTWSGSGTNWDTSSLNWAEGDQLFHAGDAVVFDDTAAGKSTNVNLTGSIQPGTIIVNNTRSGAATYTIGGSGAISGATTLLKQGSGALNLTNANTYTGTTTVAGGTLLVSNTSGSATGSGNVMVQQGGTLGGSGKVAGNVYVNGTISPSAGGTTSALLTSGNQYWNATGTYAVLVNDGTGMPGIGWDEMVINGGVQQVAGFTIQPVANGMPANVVLNTTYDWIIAKVNSGTFDTSMLTLDASYFNTGYINHFLLTTQDVSGGGQELVLRYYSSVPEATTLLLGLAGLTPLLMQRRTRGGVAA